METPQDNQNHAVPPPIVSGLRDVTTIADDTIHLSCQISGDVSSVVWLKDELEIVESPHNEVKRVEDTFTLVIRNCCVADTGQYSVRASVETAVISGACFLDVYDIDSCKELIERNFPDAFMIEDDLEVLINEMEKEPCLKNIHYQDLRAKGGSDQITTLVYYLECLSTEDCIAFLKLLHGDNLQHTIEFMFGPTSVESRRLRTAIAQREIDQSTVDKWRREGKSIQKILQKIEQKKASVMKAMRKYVLADDLLEPVNSKPLVDLVKLPRINVVFIGKTGTGKSATANTLLGRPEFEECMSAMSTTHSIVVKETIIGGQSFKIIDVPGFLDTERTIDDVRMDVAKIFHECPEGIHVFFYVKLATVIRFTKEEQDVKQQVQDTFLEKVFDHTVLLLTHAEGTFRRRSLEMYLDENARQGDRFTSLVEAINHQVLAVENKPDKCYASELTRRCLVNIINKVLVNVNHEVYTHEFFRTAEHIRKQQEEVRDEVRQIRVKSECQHFQNAYMKGKRLAKGILDGMLAHKTYAELKAERRNGFRILQREVERQLRHIVPEEDNLLFLKLSNDNIVPFTSIAIEAVYERTTAFLTQLAQREGDEEYCKDQQRLLHVKFWIQNVMDEVGPLMTEHFDPQPRDIGWFVGNYRDVVVQKLKTHLDEVGPSKARLDAEVDHQIKVVFNQMCYEHLIDNVYRDFDKCAWVVIKKYVQQLTRSEFEKMDEGDYDNILENIREKLTHESNVYLTSDYMMAIVKQRISARYSDLEKLAKLFSCTIL